MPQARVSNWPWQIVAEAVSEPAPSPPADEQPQTAAVWTGLLASLAVAAAFPVAAAVAWWLQPRRRIVAAGAPARGGAESGVESWIESWLASGLETLLESLPAFVVGAIAAVWVFVFWSVIGSFLNVVVYRLPLGRSVVSGGSSCPRCGRAITWRDNLPVVGWLLLGGRCRACALTIAARYPIVEAACAGLCTAVFFRELPSDGANIPLRTPGFWTGINWVLTSLQPDLLALYVWHCLALCTLLAWGLIVQDGHRVPGRAVRHVLAAATAATGVLPLLHPLPVAAGSELLTAAAAWPDWLVRGLAVSVAGGLTGGLAGLLLGGMLRLRLEGDAAGRSGLPLVPPRSLAAGLALVGIACGWQGMLGTATVLLAACLLQLLAWSALRGWPTLAVELLLVPAAFVHLCAWKQLGDTFGRWWPGAEPGPLCLVIPATLAGAVLFALTLITPAAASQEPV